MQKGKIRFGFESGKIEKSYKLSENAPRVLLVGYNGANNTGSEARLISIIEDVRNVLGLEVRITLPTFNEVNLRRYLQEEPTLSIVSVPSIFFFAIKRLVREHDLVMLVEGSCYMDTWASALLWAFLWTTKYAKAYEKPCIAYAVDAGDLSPSNKRRVQREASKTDLIITRTKQAADLLKSMGVTAPIEVTADSAFTFQVSVDDKQILKKIWPDAGEGVVGFSAVDFYLWPVVIRLWGRREDCYRWPYYFSRTKKRVQASEDLAKCWAAEADRIIETHGRNIALLCMEELDEPLARKIHSKMRHSSKARVFSSGEFHASEMTAILRSLDLLVTSRYHAAILSLESAVPQIALGHDTRLKGLYQDMELYDDYFVHHSSTKMWDEVKDKVDDLIENPIKMKGILKRAFKEHLIRAQRNRKLLRNFIKKKGWKVRE